MCSSPPQVFYNRLISKMHLASEDLNAPVVGWGGLVSASLLLTVIIFMCLGPQMSLTPHIVSF